MKKLKKYKIRNSSGKYSFVVTSDEKRAEKYGTVISLEDIKKNEIIDKDTGNSIEEVNTTLQINPEEQLEDKFHLLETRLKKLEETLKDKHYA